MVLLLCNRERRITSHFAEICVFKCFSGGSPQIQLFNLTGRGTGKRECYGILLRALSLLVCVPGPDVQICFGDFMHRLKSLKVFAGKQEENMGDKDKSEKLFVACRDVFVELVNVLVYQGEKVLAEEMMFPGPTESIYLRRDTELTCQFQDYSMYEVVRGEIHALYTMENQSYVDYQMVLRHAGYEGAAYRRQYGQKKLEEQNSSEERGIYPVISLVLNWGEKRWTAATAIHDLIGYPVHRAAEDYVDKNRMHVFDMRFLDEMVRNLFEGDVRVVLDYLSDRESLIRRRQELRNPEAVMRMLHALSGDIRYLENTITMKEKGGLTVCDLLDEMVNKGIEMGKQEGIEEGIQKGIRKGIQEGLKALISTCRELGISFEETTIKVKEKFYLGDEEAKNTMKLYW